MPNRRIVSRSVTGVLGALFVLLLVACGQTEGETFAVSVSLQGNGTGVVTSEPAGIDTSATDGNAADFAAGTEVTLTANPDAGSLFDGWGEACSGTVGDTCTVTVDQATAVTATFVQQVPQTDYTLTVTTSGAGTGTVTSAPAGIDTSATNGNAADFADGTSVTLTATPATDSDFLGWTGGACSGVGTCEVTLDADTSVDAEFRLESAATPVSFSIAQGSDDAEEFLTDSGDTSYPAGSVYTTSTKLDLVYDLIPNNAKQVVGLRFQNVSVPQGAVIGSASITFTAVDAGAGTVTYTLRGEDTDSAVTFTDDGSSAASSGITTRATTTASAEWDVSDPWTASNPFATSDLSDIVQEIVDRANWAPDNALAFIISSANSDDLNYRIADTFETTGGTPAQLSISYHIP